MRAASDSIVLIGPMGSGKSTVGRCLALLLNKNFVDSDEELEERCGADIPWIFDIEGEEGFRKRETAVLEDLSKRKNSVIATGGGAVLAERNRRILRSAGFVVYLTADLEVLFKRVEKDKSRPLLQVSDPQKAYEEIFNQRDPLYRATADLVFVSNEILNPNEVAKKVQARLLEIE